MESSQSLMGRNTKHCCAALCCNAPETTTAKLIKQIGESCYKKAPLVSREQLDRSASLAPQQPSRSICAWTTTTMMMMIMEKVCKFAVEICALLSGEDAIVAGLERLTGRREERQRKQNAREVIRVRGPRCASGPGAWQDGAQTRAH